jgi:HSP90 family molecular chaperone
MEPGVSLFSRKVLIQAKSKLLLPDWLRFIRGVVDSEDIPLNLSREHLQDSQLIRRVSSVLTKRVLKFLEDKCKNDRQRFEKFYSEFGGFLKEGILTDTKWKDDIARILLYESSAFGWGKLTTMEEYISRMKPDQKEIYFLCVPSRQAAENSPYFEAFKKTNMEVLFVYTNVDDFVMANLTEFGGKTVKTIESADLDIKPEDKETKLHDEELRSFCKWMKEALSDKVLNVKETYRLSSTPAIVVDHESASFRRMMRFVDPNRAPQLPKQNLDINPSHPVILKLNQARKSRPDVAKRIAEQVYDNALVAAGLLDDPRTMLNRLNNIIEDALSGEGSIPFTQKVEQKEEAKSASA